MRALVFGLLIVCPAGFPMRATVRRPQAGTVVDARTGAPIPGAPVVVESWQMEAPPGNMAYRWLLHTAEIKTDGIAQKYGATLITADGGSKRQPGGILGSQEALAALDIHVITDAQAVALVEERIRQRDELARQWAAIAHQDVPSWVGADL